MSEEVEYYVGMRVIAQGREGTISRVLNSGYDVSFPDGQVAHNLPAASITPFDTAPVNKQEGGPPPPEYNPGVSAPVGVVTNPVIYQGYHPQQQTVHGPHGGATVVIHAATATPVTVSASSSHLNAPLIVPQSNKVPGYAYSPNIGEPLNDLFNFDASCWMACCCPCIIGGQVTQKLGVAPYALVCCGYIVICLILFFVCILMDNLLPFILLWIGWGMFVFILRMKVKSLWQISGQGCEECVLAVFCIACSLAQISRHVFGYKPNDVPPCTSDGTPNWQKQQPQNSQSSLPTNTSHQSEQNLSHQQENLHQHPEYVGDRAV